MVATGLPTKTAVDHHNAFDKYTYHELEVHRYRHCRSRPLSAQCPMEAEYRNNIAAQWFRGILSQFQPDVVHVYHLKNLSAAIIEVCIEQRVPVVFSATDFWLICPTTQLVLPDFTLCKGPQEDMINCIKHLTALGTDLRIWSILKVIPSSFLYKIIWGLKKTKQTNSTMIANVCAVMERQKYINKQMDRVDRILVTNHFMKDVLIRHRIRSELIQKIPFGIVSPNKSKFQIDPEAHKIKIGFIGTLNYHKGAHILLKAIRCLSEEDSLIVKVYGNQDQFPLYVRLLKRIAKGDQRIKFEGTFANHQIYRIMKGIDILVVPSIWYENTPLVILSAQAFGLPVIATDLGGINEIVTDRKNGFLFKRGDDHQLSKIIQTLIHDRSQLKRLSDNIDSPKSMETYTDEIENIYRSITRKQKKEYLV